MGRIEGDGRRIARAAIGEPFQPKLVGMGYMIEQGEARHPRARIGHGKAWGQTQRRRAIIHGGQAHCPAHLLHKGIGAVSLYAGDP